MSLVDFLDRPIAFHRSFVGLGIGVTGALMLSQVVYWARRTKDVDGWFFKTQEEWEDETGLTRTEQETARRRLRELGLLEEDRRGVPCKTFFRLRVDVLEARMHGGQAAFQFAENQQASLRKPCKQERGKPADRAAENPRTNTRTTKLLPTGTTSDKQRGTRLPKDWALPDDWRQVATEIGIPPGAVDVEALQFRDHWTSKSRDNTKLDWLATWRTWCRNAVKWTYKKPAASGTNRHGGFDKKNYNEGVNPDGSF